MRLEAFRARILAAIGASSVAIGGMSACGGDDTTPSSSGAGGTTASTTAAGTGGATTAGAGGTMTAGVGGEAGVGTAGAGAGGAMGAGAGGAAGAATGTAGSGGASSLADSGVDGRAKPDGSFGGGGLPSPRRPFLVGSSLRLAAAIARDDWMIDAAPSATSIDPKTRAALASAWLQDALEEHASIAAFARLTMSMLSVGAPPDMIAGSQRASLDEIGHARACFGLAVRYGAKRVGPAALPIADAIKDLSLEDLAALTFEEGCFGETLGALIATEQLARATDPVVARILRKIAVDEARHAELAWRFVSWAIGVGGTPIAMRVRETLRDATRAIGDMVIRDEGVDLIDWHAHGRLSCKEAREASLRGIREVIIPCTDAVSKGGPESLSRPLAARVR